MVWTDSTNGDAGLVHVRDLATGEESSFDPHNGERCNLLDFGATGDRIVMGQYCGTYDGQSATTGCRSSPPTATRSSPSRTARSTAAWTARTATSSS